jgi:large subunit ribosomal protein L13
MSAEKSQKEVRHEGAVRKIVIDATKATLGRLASYAAKQALLGKEIIIVNCNNAVVTGDRRMIINEYKIQRQRGSSTLKGPHFPNIPEKLLKRTIRGMLRYKRGKSREAFKRILCYDKVPAEYENVKKIVAGKEKKGKLITLAELYREL